MRDFKNMLCALNLDDEANASLVFALEFAQMFQASLHVVYVNDAMAGYRHPADREDAIALKVKQTVPGELLDNANIVYGAARGDTAEEIVQYARMHQIDLIIVGHRHRGKLYSSLLDSTDVNIVDAADIPVLVVPEK